MQCMVRMFPAYADEERARDFGIAMAKLEGVVPEEDREGRAARERYEVWIHAYNRRRYGAAG